MTDIRSWTYAFLGRFFLAPPEMELVLSLLSKETISSLPPGGNDSPGDQGLALIRKELEICRQNPKDFHQKILADYTQLFIGPHKLPAPPWESVYRSSRKLVMQEPHLQVRQEYLKAGLFHDRMGVGPDDHIGLELFFMAELASAACSASQEGQAEEADKWLTFQRNFFNNHLYLWAINFFRDVAGTAKTDFYRGLALWAQDFLERDNYFLNPK